MSKYSIENLTKDQYRLIIEALLFSASSDTNASWYAEEDQTFMEMAVQLRQKHPEVLLKDVFILEDGVYHDEFTKTIMENFPEIIEAAPRQ